MHQCEAAGAELDATSSPRRGVPVTATTAITASTIEA